MKSLKVMVLDSAKKLKTEVLSVKENVDNSIELGHTLWNTQMSKGKTMKGSYGNLDALPKFILSFGIVVGIALTVLGNFQTGLGAGTAQNTVSNVAGYFNQGLVNFGYLIILAVFVGTLYLVLHEAKII